MQFGLQLSTAISQKAEGQALGDIEAVLRRFGTELEALRHSSDDNLAKLRYKIQRDASNIHLRRIHTNHRVDGYN